MQNRVDFKVVMLGSEFVGKTSMVIRFVHSTFNDEGNTYQNTIGAAYSIRRMKTSEGQDFAMGIWDTAGSERFEAMSRLYYRGARAAVLCYDPRVEGTWRKLLQWIIELRQSDPDCRLYICATKVDLLSAQRPRVVARKEAENHAHRIGAFYAETSSLTGENIQELFQQIAEDSNTDTYFMERMKKERLRLKRERQLDQDARRTCNCS